ncbi:dTDP-4-dehydrorhamnose reductase [Candidatus Woesearchaeota archaeon]|nr:dTDP-4-dehydrorhamnose reductase [Candidatus Woesearchaeota archaeon]
MKIVILGTNGMLGKDIAEAFSNFDVYPFDKRELDITNARLLDMKLKAIKPDFVINAAGYTDVDGCETNKELAYNVNANGVKNIAVSCSKYGSTLIHISSDYVFDGEKDGYSEHANPSPINIYGDSKYKGELYLMDASKRYYLIRTSWLFGKNGRNFVDTILRLSKTKTQLEVVNDQRGSPTYTKDLSIAIKNMINNNPEFGIYHLTNSGVCTWFEFAKEIIKIKGLKVDIEPISSEKLNRPAKRPKCSVLINNKLPKLRNWKEAVKDYLANEK